MDNKKSPRNTRRSSARTEFSFFAKNGLSMTVTTQPTRRLRRSLAAHPTRYAPGAFKRPETPVSATARRRDGLTSDRRARLKALERGNKQLRQANGILRKASAYFAQAELDRQFGK